MSEYNYERFERAREEGAFGRFTDHLHVGRRAPDATLEDLETGDTVELRSLWRRAPAVVEFGSFT